MGLAEKRVIKQYQDESFPQFQAELTALVGKEVPLDIRWDEFETEISSENLMEGIQNCYFKPVIEGLKPICADAMGKEALAGALKSITLQNSTKREDCPGEDISFTDGVLLIDQRLQNYWDAFLEERVNAVTRAIESAL
jgi:hypothetical protein